MRSRGTVTDGRIEDKPYDTVDLTSQACPMTFVVAKIHLEEMDPGELLEVVLKEGEQMRDFPRNIKEEGHRIENVRKDGDRYYLLVRKHG
jgi:tRNA 2-thiouridine synthesizing protein A